MIETACTLVMHPDTGRHDTGWGHPEHQGRLPAIVKAIEKDTLALLHAVSSRQAEPCPEALLGHVHSLDHIEAVRAFCDRAASTGRPVAVGGDTVVSAASWDAALASAGCAVDAARVVAEGNSRTAFALCRPPGHHATPDRAMGFCLFNNVAIAARTLQRAHGAGRILIIDWDVHHGNGTQDTFFDDGSVYYLSLHQHPWYPGTGSPAERGAGPGVGTTRNVQLPAAMQRSDYLSTFVAAVDAACDEFTPEFILISAGYDCLEGDPLGGLLLEPADIHAMTRTVMERAAATANGRVIALLEGGYAPVRTGRGVVATLRALAGLDSPD